MKGRFLMTNTKSTFVRKIKRMSRKAPVRIVAVVLAVLLVMNVTSILTNLSVFAQTQEDYAVIGIEMNGKTSVVEYRAKEDCSLVVAVYDDDGAKMLGSGNATVAANKQSAEVEISIDEMPQYYLVKAFLVNSVNNYPLCDAFSKTFPVSEEPTEDLPELYTPDGDNIAYASEENFYYMNNMVIIVFADDAEQSEIDSVIASINGKAVGKNKYINQYQVEIATGTSNLPFELRRKAGPCSRVTAGPIDLIQACVQKPMFLSGGDRDLGVAFQIRCGARRGLLRRTESAALLPQRQRRRDVADGAPLRRDRTIRHKNND